MTITEYRGQSNPYRMALEAFSLPLGHGFYDETEGITVTSLGDNTITMNSEEGLFTMTARSFLERIDLALGLSKMLGEEPDLTSLGFEPEDARELARLYLLTLEQMEQTDQ